MVVRFILWALTLAQSKSLHDFRQDPLPVTSLGLEHDGSQETLRGIGTDFHPPGDLFGCVSLHQKPEGLGFPLRQAEFLTDL